MRLAFWPPVPPKAVMPPEQTLQARQQQCPHFSATLSICSLHLPQLPQQASCSITRQDLHVAPLEVPTCFELIALPLAQFESH